MAFVLPLNLTLVRKVSWWYANMQIGTIGNSGYEHANRVYKGGCCPVLQSRDFKDPIKVIKSMDKKIIVKGCMDNSDGTHECINRVYSRGGSCCTLNSMGGGDRQPKTVRVIGGIGEENEFGKQFRQQNRVYDNKQLSVSMTSIGINGLYPRKETNMKRKCKGVLNTNCERSKQMIEDNFDEELAIATQEDKRPTVEDYLITAKDGDQYGIFKLSPRECGRLMNVRDEDITKMLVVNSNTQCYKSFGNSIVVSVLVGIFSQLGIKGVKRWNDMTDAERYEIIKPGG